MKLIERKTHGFLDYFVGLMLIPAPWLFDFARGGYETTVFVALGVATIIYSFFTNYELGVVRMIPFRTHLAIDVLNGLLLAASPWIFGFSEHVYLPHLIIGIAELGVVALTVARNYTGTSNEHVRLSTH